MTTHQDFLGLVDARSQRRRPPVVGMQFLHEGAMRSRDFVTRGALLKPQDLISFIFGHRAAEMSAPRVDSARIRIVLACRTPSGKTAVKINL